MAAEALNFVHGSEKTLKGDVDLFFRDIDLIYGYMTYIYIHMYIYIYIWDVQNIWWDECGFRICEHWLVWKFHKFHMLFVMGLADDLVVTFNPWSINPRLFIWGRYNFSSQVLLFGGTTTTNQPGFFSQGLTLTDININVAVDATGWTETLWGILLQHSQKFIGRWKDECLVVCSMVKLD